VDAQRQRETIFLSLQISLVLVLDEFLSIFPFLHILSTSLTQM